MRKVDIHNHLGKNGANPGFDETIDIVRERLGFGGVFGIANSNDFRYEKFVEQKGGKYSRVHISDKRAVHIPEKSMLVIKCQEIFSRQGHILAVAMPYGKNIQTDDAANAIREAFDLNAVLDAVHPCYIDGIGKFLEQNPAYLQFFSTLEVFNGSAVFIPGCTIAFANKKAMNFYTPLWRNNIGISSSTDGHSVESIGKCYTILDDFPFVPEELPKELDSRFRSIKSLNRLHTEYNKLDAYKHFLQLGGILR